MTGRTRVWRHAGSLTAWWLLLALVLWVLGRAADQDVSLPGCVVSGAFLVGLGEVGDWLRRRRRAHRARRTPR
ncbi:hypothetical protein [Streptomyces sp. NPDC014995]|uniref:hypothetical protein n=1 Tax=Streptomyces sp. NPDC014995 TaxID=3364936 RepID=UPI0036F9DFF4